MTWGVLAAAIILVSTSSWAAEISTELQVELQSAMLNHLDEVAVDGAYTYVDTKADQLMTVYPANIHPFVVPIGEDYFVCSEMIDEEGNTLTADFLVREISGEYRVVQSIMNDREAVQAAMSKLEP